MKSHWYSPDLETQYHQRLCYRRNCDPQILADKLMVGGSLITIHSSGVSWLSNFIHAELESLGLCFWRFQLLLAVGYRSACSRAKFGRNVSVCISEHYLHVFVYKRTISVDCWNKQHYEGTLWSLKLYSLYFPVSAVNAYEYRTATSIVLVLNVFWKTSYIHLQSTHHTHVHTCIHHSA